MGSKSLCEIVASGLIASYLVVVLHLSVSPPFFICRSVGYKCYCDDDNNDDDELMMKSYIIQLSNFSGDCWL